MTKSSDLTKEARKIAFQVFKGHGKDVPENGLETDCLTSVSLTIRNRNMAAGWSGELSSLRPQAFLDAMKKKGVPCSVSRMPLSLSVTTVHGGIEVTTRFEPLCAFCIIGKALRVPWCIRNMESYVESLGFLERIAVTASNTLQKLYMEHGRKVLEEKIADAANRAFCTAAARRIGADEARYSGNLDHVRFIMSLDGGTRTVCGTTGMTEKDLRLVEETVSGYISEGQTSGRGPVRVWDVSFTGQNFGEFEHSVTCKDLLEQE